MSRNKFIIIAIFAIILGTSANYSLVHSTHTEHSGTRAYLPSGGTGGFGGGFSGGHK